MNYPFLRVCSGHFIKGKPAALYEETNPDWVPSLNLGHGEKRSLATSSRHDRSAKQKRNGEEQDKGKVEREIIEIDRDHEVNSEEAAKSELEQVKDQLGAACVEISHLKNNLSVLALEEEACKANDKKVYFYSGIPSWDLLSKLFYVFEASS